MSKPFISPTSYAGSSTGFIPVHYVYVFGGVIAISIGVARYSNRIRFRLQLQNQTLSIDCKAFHTNGHHITHHNIDTLTQKYTISFLKSTVYFYPYIVNNIGTATIPNMSEFRNDCERVDAFTKIGYYKSTVFGYHTYYEKTIQWKDIHHIQTLE